MRQRARSMFQPFVSPQTWTLGFYVGPTTLQIREDGFQNLQFKRHLFSTVKGTSESWSYLGRPEIIRIERLNEDAIRFFY